MTDGKFDRSGQSIPREGSARVPDTVKVFKKLHDHSPTTSRRTITVPAVLPGARMPQPAVNTIRPTRTSVETAPVHRNDAECRTAQLLAQRRTGQGNGGQSPVEKSPC